MNATAPAQASTVSMPPMDELKSRLKKTWMAGDYDRFCRYMEKGAEEFFARLPVQPGAKLLDVGCGAGQLALIAARKGVNVTGCDIATNWLEQAQARADGEGLTAKFEEGDAESLPYPDDAFDTVTTLIGAMFAPRPEMVAAQLTRVCRPGGMIAMANWTPGGFIGQMFKIIARHIAPPGMPSPVLWGDETIVTDRLSRGIARLEMSRRMYPFEYPFSPADVVEFFRQNYGPMTRAFAALEGEAQARLRSELVDLWSKANSGSGNTTQVDAEYLEVIAVKQ